MNRLALLAFVLVAGCAAPLVRMEPLASQGQEVEYQNGAPTVVSRGDRFDVALSPRGGATGRYQMGARVALLIGVRNRSDHRVEVSESSVTATGNDSPAPVVRATDIEDSILRSAGGAQGMDAMAGALGAGASSPGTTSYTVSGVAGGRRVDLTGESHDQGAAQRAQQREAVAHTERIASAIDARATAGARGVATVFQRNTIRPGESYVGVAIIEPPRRTACGVPVATRDGAVAMHDGPCRLRISVAVDGELHTFQLDERVSERTSVTAGSH